MQKDMSGMCDKIDKIHLALVGDTKFGQEGLVRMVRKHEEWLQRTEIYVCKDLRRHDCRFYNNYFSN